MIPPGTRLGPYEIAAQIGAGGMGEVYRATDTTLKRQVALKVLPEMLATDGERLARFQREAEVLASLNHPNIAVLYGLEKSDGVTALVMELVDGPTLADRIVAAPIPVEEALDIARQVAEALEAAHERGIIHRDLKPANVKVRPDGAVKVLDFGLAKAMGPSDVGHSAHDRGVRLQPDVTASPTLSLAATQQGIVLGTAAYMSPEQAKGQPVDRRADIFAFGCVLFEMLTGQRAFRGELVAEIMASVINQEPDYARLTGTVPPRVELLLRRCLKKDPRQRWQAAGDLRLELEEVLREPGGADHAVRGAPPTRARTQWMGWAVAAVAAVTGASAWYLKPPAPAPVTKVAVDLVAAPAITDAVAVSPDGRRIVYAADGRLWVRALDQTESVTIPGTEDGRGAFFSPDGTRIAFFTLTQLKTVDLRGGLPVVLAAVELGLHGVWDDRGRLFFGRVGPAGLMMVAETGGAAEPFAPLEKQVDIDFPDALPGGEWILYSRQRSANWDDGQIVARSVATGEERVLLEHGFYARYVSTGHLVYVRGRTLYAIRFDVDRLQVVGDPVPMVEDVQTASFIAGQAQFAVSRNGTLIYRKATEHSSELALVDDKGGVERLDLPPGVYVNPRLSPDGARFAFESVDNRGASTMLVHSLAGTTRPRELARDATNPVWSLDGQWIVFNGADQGVPGVYRQRADGSGSRELLIKSTNEERWLPQAWSPDGRVLLLMRSGNPGGLFSFSPDGGGEPQLIPHTTNALASGACFSPDGKWIAYSRAAAGTPLTISVHVQPFPPTGPEYRISPDMRMYPVWSRTNEVVSMAGLIAESIGLVGVSVTPGASVEAAERERMLPINVSGHRLQSTFDMDPSGRRILAALPSQQGRAQLNVIINWFEELKHRVPR